MPSEDNTIKTFTDLHAWKAGQKVVVEVYRMTQSFPSEERFGLSNQMRRSAISITSNIAEGFGRNTAKDKIQFYGVARGSILELQSQLYAARDIGYVTSAEAQELENVTTETAKLVSGLMRSAVDK